VLDGPAKDSKGGIWYKVSAPGGTGWIVSDFLSGKGNSTGNKTAASIARGGTALVANTDGSTIRVRSGAGTTYDQVAEAHEGESVSVLDGPAKDSSGNVWYKVSAPGGTGWIVRDFLVGKSSPSSGSGNSSNTKPQAASASKPAAPSGPKLTGFARVGNSDGDPVRLRATANSNGAVLAKFSPDTSVAIKQGPVVDSAGVAWYEVSGNGTTGWMMAEYLIQAEAPASPAAPKAPAATPVAQVQAPAAPAQDPAPAPVAPAPAPVEAQVPVAPVAPVEPPAAPAAPAAPAPPVEAPAPAAPVAAPAAPAEPPAPVAAVPAAPAAQAPAAPAAPAAAPASPSRGNIIVSTALKYVGARYAMGGVGPRYFDCSGFVYFVMNHSGVGMSRDMYAQWNSGPHISSSNLAAGDILFFSNTYKRGLSHVGIYIGNGRFVHAENESTGVLVSDLWSSYYRAHYTGAVRPSR
jgi:cell wall-associated NlpC family hydrolase